MRYRIEGQFATGEVLNISSNGVYFTTDQSISLGTTLELFISWPVLLHNAVPLNLVATGPIVRTEAGTAAVRIHKYEFRTSRGQAGKRDSAQTEARSQMTTLCTVPAFGGASAG